MTKVRLDPEGKRHRGSTGARAEDWKNMRGTATEAPVLANLHKRRERERWGEGQGRCSVVKIQVKNGERVADGSSTQDQEIGG